MPEGERLADLADEFPEILPAHFWSASGCAPPPNPLFDAVLMGRKTHAVGMQIGIAQPVPDPPPALVSRTLAAPPTPEIELIAAIRWRSCASSRASLAAQCGSAAAAPSPPRSLLEIDKLNP